MTALPNETTAKLIRTIAENMDGPVVDYDNWESMTAIVDSFEGTFNSVSGYLYSPDGTISAVAADPWKVIPVVDEYINENYKPGTALPLKFLVQYNRKSGKYQVIFEDTDETRWKITPKNYKELREKLRPILDKPERDVLFSRKNGWMPQVIRNDGDLYLELGAGATANHEPRTFTIPISENHLEVIKNDFNRHLLLWSAILPLCDAAGTQGPLDEEAATALLDPILLGSEYEIEVLFKNIKWYSTHLISHHADPKLLDAGEVFAALKTVTEESDPSLAAIYSADRERASREVVLSELDAAILKYTNQFLYRSGIPSRKPEAVDPEILPKVLEVVAIAEQACAGMEFIVDPKSDEYTAERKLEWNTMSDKVEEAIRTTYPDLVDDTVHTLSNLMCSEAFSRRKKRLSEN